MDESETNADKLRFWLDMEMSQYESECEEDPDYEDEETREALQAGFAVVAEHKALTAENERLKSENQGWRSRHSHVTSERDDILRERNQLDAENERLKDVVAEVVRMMQLAVDGDWDSISVDFVKSWIRLLTPQEGE